MREMFQTLNQHRKENPKDFYSTTFYAIFLFASSYGMLWVAAILGGRA
jgi:hypothetical protein